MKDFYFPVPAVSYTDGFVLTIQTTEGTFFKSKDECVKVERAKVKSFPVIKTDVPPTISVTGVSLNKSSLELTVGGTETLTATVSPSNATNKAVTWSSDKTSVATVDANGKVTAIAEGTATITVKTTDGAKTATCAVTVKPNNEGVDPTASGTNPGHIH